jgi:hypothetical protein
VYVPLTDQALRIPVPVVNGTSYGVSGNGTNSVNVVNTAYWNSTAFTIHFQTPFQLNGPPVVKYGTSNVALTSTASGNSSTYGKVCSSKNYTVCNAFFHNVLLTGLQPKTRYYYQIQGDSSGINATQPVLSFKSPMLAGDR